MLPAPAGCVGHAKAPRRRCGGAVAASLAAVCLTICSLPPPVGASTPRPSAAREALWRPATKGLRCLLLHETGGPSAAALTSEACGAWGPTQVADLIHTATLPRDLPERSCSQECREIAHDHRPWTQLCSDSISLQELTGLVTLQVKAFHLLQSVCRGLPSSIPVQAEEPSLISRQRRLLSSLPGHHALADGHRRHHDTPHDLHSHEGLHNPPDRGGQASNHSTLLPGIVGFWHIGPGKGGKNCEAQGKVAREQLRELKAYEIFPKVEIKYLLSGDPVDNSTKEQLAAEPTLTAISMPGDFDEEKNEPYEFPTLVALWRHCHDHSADFVFYIHSKGKREIRSKLQRALFQDYEDVFQKLREGKWAFGGYACGGKNYCALGGNFWWARCDHVVKLNKPYDPHYVAEGQKSGNYAFNPPKGRYHAEYWVLNDFLGPQPAHVPTRRRGHINNCMHPIHGDLCGHVGKNMYTTHGQ